MTKYAVFQSFAIGFGGWIVWRIVWLARREAPIWRDQWLSHWWGANIARNV